MSSSAVSVAAAAPDLKPFDVTRCPYITIYFQGSGVLSSGVITIEEASQQNAAAWFSVTTMNAADVTAGAAKAIHLPVGAYGWLRCRISTALGGGGTVSARQETIPI